MFLFNVYFHFFVVVNVAVDVVLSQEQPVVATIISTFCSEMIYIRGEKEERKRERERNAPTTKSKCSFWYRKK